jgi:hypothetical protein
LIGIQLTAGIIRAQKQAKSQPPFLESVSYRTDWTTKGETLSVQKAGQPDYSKALRAITIQDIRLTSVFGFWAVVLGILPALAFHALMAS